MSGKDRTLYFLLALLVFCYILARAVLVPFVHDEAATFNVYVPFGEFLPWLSHWDAGNHFLNTALGIVGYKLFGMEQWALRGGNVLAFLLYVWMVWRLGEHVRDRVIRWCMWLALLLCPFLMEFFSLFRGYGLEMAFFIWAVHALLCFARDGRSRDLVQVLVALCLANACILALLPFWGIVLAFLALLITVGTSSIVQKVRQLSTWLLLGMVPFALAAQLAMQMQEMGLLYYGSPDGFVMVTLTTLCRYVLGTHVPAVLIMVIAFFIGLTVMALRASQRERNWRSPSLVVVTLIWAEVMARTAMAVVLGVNFPEDRAALHLVPLFILGLALCVDQLSARTIAMRYAALVLLVLPLRTIVTANTDHTVLWPEHSPPHRFIDRLLALQAAQERPLVIGCYHSMHFSLPFAARLRGEQLPLPQVLGFPDGPHDVRVAHDAHLQEALPGFHEVDHDRSTGLHLLERNVPLRPQVGQVRAFAHDPNDAEFVELLRMDSLALGDDLLVEVEADFDTRGPATINLVVEVRDVNDKAIHYDAVCVSAFAPFVDRLREVRRIPPLPDGHHAVVYLWNIRRNALTLQNGSVRVFRLPALASPLTLVRSSKHTIFVVFLERPSRDPGSLTFHFPLFHPSPACPSTRTRWPSA